MDASEFESLTRKHLPEVVDESLAVSSLIERSGSGRQFARFSGSGGQGVIAMHYSLDRPENGRFVAITDFLRSRGIPAPAILGNLEDHQLIWLEDLGADDLVSFQHADWTAIRRPLYLATLEAIHPLHRIRENHHLPGDLPGLEPPFNAALYSWEQDYFFEHFVANFSDCPPGELRKNRDAGELHHLAAELGALPRSLIHRDFQSSNIMIREGRPWLIDYQGMRFGLPEYDLASLLYDPYVELSESQRDDLARHYFTLEAPSADPEPFENFRERLDRCAAQRLMQALGAYGNLGLNKGQPDFLEFIPAALANLHLVAVERGAIPSLSPVLSLKKSRVA